MTKKKIFSLVVILLLLIGISVSIFGIENYSFELQLNKIANISWANPLDQFNNCISHIKLLNWDFDSSNWFTSSLTYIANGLRSFFWMMFTFNFMVFDIAKDLIMVFKAFLYLLGMN